MSGPTCRATGILVLAAWLSACTTWHEEPVAPQQFIVESRPGKVRLVMADSNVVAMRDPRILRDSVVGDQDVGNTNRRVAVPVADVLSIRTGRINIGKTLLYGSGIAAASALVIILAGQSQTGGYYY